MAENLLLSEDVPIRIAERDRLVGEFTKLFGLGPWSHCCRILRFSAHPREFISNVYVERRENWKDVNNL